MKLTIQTFSGGIEGANIVDAETGYEVGGAFGTAADAQAFLDAHREELETEAAAVRESRAQRALASLERALQWLESPDAFERELAISKLLSEIERAARWRHDGRVTTMLEKAKHRLASPSVQPQVAEFQARAMARREKVIQEELAELRKMLAEFDSPNERSRWRARTTLSYQIENGLLHHDDERVTAIIDEVKRRLGPVSDAGA